MLSALAVLLPLRSRCRRSQALGSGCLLLEAHRRHLRERTATLPIADDASDLRGQEEFVSSRYARSRRVAFKTRQESMGDGDGGHDHLSNCVSQARLERPHAQNEKQIALIRILDPVTPTCDTALTETAHQRSSRTKSHPHERGTQTVRDPLVVPRHWRPPMVNPRPAIRHLPCPHLWASSPQHA